MTGESPPPGRKPDASEDPAGGTLEVLDGKRLVFSSRSRWLHPLFELEAFLRRERIDPGGLLLQDKIVGRAAALLIVRLGFRRVHAGILSEPGRGVLEAHGLQYRCDRLVERVLCQTEEALAGVDDLEAAYRELLGRAQGGPNAKRSAARQRPPC